nr:molybdate ABC transporter substrate-binding protein [Phytoactinopolyspora alkaliphila]
MAAASLTESFTQISDELARSHPEIEIVLSFGPSSQLVEQVLAGAPVDVLATADMATMAKAADAGVLDGEATVFAANTPALVVPAGNPGGVAGLSDLEREDLRVAVCEPHVPCGAAAERLTTLAGVEPVPDTLATDVKEALALVTLGEVDVALVFHTDAVSAGEAVEVVPVEEAESVVNDYPVAVLERARQPAAARAVVEAVTGEIGRRVLTESGFLVP